MAAENNVEAEHEWSDWALDTAEDTLVAMETLLATLRAFEDVLRQQDVSTASSTEYCDNFCQALMHYAGSRNSMEHGLPLLEVYCLSINCFAAARSHLTADSDRVALVLKRLALSCFELLLSVPENEIPYEAWVQFHHSVQIAHDTLLRYGSTDLQALLQITGEGGAWSNPVLTSLLTGQTTSPEEVNTYISLEGEGFMEMRVKHLEKMGEVAKAVVLAKACTECSCISNQAMFRQTYISLLCHLLPNEEAIMEISRLDCKDVLEITCNLETEGEENTAFILCTTFLTQQLQQQSLYSSWELTLLWSKLQRRLDPSLLSLLERCLQLGAIAKTVHHLLYLVRVIQTEAEELGTSASVELCVKALQLPRGDDSETRISICKTMSCLLQDDLEVWRACQLTEFLLGPCQDSFRRLEELYLRPDQKYDQESGSIPNSLRCELLLALKAYWPFDPEFWDWKTLKYHCASLLGLKPESDAEEEEAADRRESPEPQGAAVKAEPQQHSVVNGGLGPEQHHKPPSGEQKEPSGESEAQKPKLCCRLCRRSVSDSQIVHHSKRHAAENHHPCPVCKDAFRSRKDLVPHLREHVEGRTAADVKKEDVQKRLDDDDDIEPGEITVDPSLMLYYKSTHDPDVLHHIVEQVGTAAEKHVDDDEHVTFEYIDRHYKLQNRDEYPCPGTGCTRVFKHSKYLYVHLKSEHIGDDNVKYFHQMRDKREKCVFCRRHFVSAYHHRKHRRVHYGERPYMCVVMGCGARFTTSNELVTHKQTHGYLLNYQCELQGCYVTYSDLGQIYHHEAQHFRDAAFTCSGPDCRQYHFSKKDFVKHLASHDITFSESDFEAQRRAKRKLFKTLPEAAARLRSVEPEGLTNGDDLHPAGCDAPPHRSEVAEPKATMTLVAVCFDGSKFTCGFEKCGMTFSRARDVQRHLKCAHPEHLKLENKEHKHEKEHGSKSKAIKTEPEPDPVGPGHNLPSAAGEANQERKAFAVSKSTEATKNDPLREILMGLSRLDLNSTSSHCLPKESSASDTDSNSSQVALHRAIMAKPPVVLLQKRPHLSAATVSVKEEDGLELLSTAKPYVCQAKGCGFRTAQSYSLQRHYNTRHGRTLEQAKRLTSLKTTSFKPYVCQLCSNSHRQKNVLRSHYIQVHKLSPASVESMICTSVQEGSRAASSLKTQASMARHSLKLKKKDIKAPRLHKAKSVKAVSENGQKFESPASREDEERRPEDGQQEGKKDHQTSQVRARRLVAKGNLCYILDKFSKPFHCVAKNCDAAFSTQGGLVRHLQLVHHYNRSQLLLEQDVDVQCTSEVRKEPAKKRPAPSSDEPQPRFKCHFLNCNASYHLRSSLVRHTREIHSQPPPALVRCTFDGCTQVFSHDEALKKHALYSHYECYDSLVVRLQSTHKKSITGCQKKLIVPPKTEDPAPPPAQTPQSGPAAPEPQKTGDDKAKKPRRDRRRTFSSYEYRSHEEALQMCQDRSARISFPCMVQDCHSVVSSTHSLNRHYLRVHRMTRDLLLRHQDKLVFNAEQLEELIQRKSARPTAAGEVTPIGAREPDNSGQTAPVSLHTLKTTAVKEEEEEEQQEEGRAAPGFPGEQQEDEQEEEQQEQLPPVDRKGVLVGADEVLNGEASAGESTESPPAHRPEERLSLDQITPLLRPLTVDLSPPCSLRFTAGEGFHDPSGKLLNGSLSLAAPPLRQPLKRKNELSEAPSNLKDPPTGSPSPRPFNIAAYKPIGFESSFLKFIQDTSPKDKSSAPVRRRDAFRRSCSVKENNQLGVSLTRSRRSRSPPLKPPAAAGDLTSVHNLKSILDRALAGCGDLAIKQLQYLRPVVVLGRPVSAASPPHLFPPDMSGGKLLLGS
ncbi:LOW QUALITY PROTEIN: zinc finger protein Rlf-like [Salarias fasciatus]|uniref:LOW QUALITY PROTEIN: zinc finger protein Rlf-like n=1 Tax=Salarias fasciatus TaxID=181472 RepID=UPI001176EE32|nr:LOW QUALITY PROTEIN: zinc finger protein Rlf-like [Salarias fasciatus]